MRKNHILDSCILSVFIALLTSCKSEPPVPETSISSDVTIPSITEAVEVSVPEASTNVEESSQQTEVVPSSKGDPSIPTLIWAYFPLLNVSEECQTTIDHLLKDHGISCNMEFVSIPMDYKNDAFYEWLDMQEELGRMPDIVSTGLWARYYDNLPFIYNELYPLNDYLRTEEGREAFSIYTEVELKKTYLNGNIYGAPVRLGGFTSPGDYYIQVDNRYKDEFEATYDGSYQSLRKIIEAHSDSGMYVGMVNVFPEVMAAWLGYQPLEGFSWYDPITKKIIDPTKHNDIKEGLRLICSDLVDKRLIIRHSIDPSTFPKGMLAYVTAGWGEEIEGYTGYRIYPELYISGTGWFGVSKRSDQKELAMRVLTLCYSDPTVASMIDWRVADPEGWNRRTEQLKDSKPSWYTGFVPDLSLKQREDYTRYYMDFDELFSGMYLEKGGQTEFNPDFLKHLDEFFEKDYGDVFDVINEQLGKWIESQEQ